MIKQHASSPTRSGSSPSTDTHWIAGVGPALRTLVHVYRAVISPMLPRTCRFHPSCSSFALDALAEHGALVGTRLTLTRIARCHPWNPGGYDPVPPRKV